MRHTLHFLSLTHVWRRNVSKLETKRAQHSYAAFFHSEQSSFLEEFYRLYRTEIQTKYQQLTLN